jgi:hypothetical protein
LGKKAAARSAEEIKAAARKGMAQAGAAGLKGK